MAGGEKDTRHSPGALTEEQAERMLAGMNDVIRAGEEMRKLRAEMIRLFIGFGWTQDRIARLTDMSQPAVSKQVTKYRSADPAPSMDLSLGQHDVPWLEGRLWGLAEDISETYADAARCTGCVSALARGRKRFTPENVDELRRLVEDDLRRYGEGVPDVQRDADAQALSRAHRDAYDEISRGLDVPSRQATAPAGAAPLGSASVRRTLAHRIQRDRLRDGS
ncbi:hypothetical protein EES39_13240 [Streptomyces sp. ADI92-24]|uniref:sigma-70 family RNA polymerase sigma factor n=1 Tax=Streptomyces sp. ADI92-24 TaxID=1522756 RepID=UPI000F54F345|nr:sigma-70 family RNA polymerase sigma factor [Streptomyces sp. ADI92-24]RPK46569.1 hypothetical protein EES39_13240 [Streptomyces sp. ADI92-24]